ncbi:penicillin-binding protein activator [Chromatiaceae bacterium AAb-1]|nr:penicillin-binding protein activator [Chromatiaceae bacterium AAb-1]
MTSSKLKPLLILTLSYLIISCAQQQASGPSGRLPSEQHSAPEHSGGFSSEQLYQQSRLYSGEAQQRHLLNTAVQAIHEQNYLLALAITENLKDSHYPVIRRHIQLPLLQAYLGSAQLNHAAKMIEATKLTDIAETDISEYLWQTAGYLTTRQRHLAAAETLLKLDAQPDAHQQYPELSTLLWQHLNALTSSELLNLKTGASRRTQGWLELAEISRRYIGQTESLQQALRDWQRRYPMMPAVDDLPENLQQLLTLQPYQPQKIAVLLPLSGQYRQHAQAIQYGLLTAASQSGKHQTTELLFINSQQTPDELKQQLLAQQIDFVIGPLLREEVDILSHQEDWSWPTLFLNSRDDQAASRPGQFYFALSMEDEAAQMAQLFQHKNYQRPVVISARNPVSQRMLQHFSQQWQQLGNSQPEHYQFSAKEELEALVTQLLETDKSKERVREVANLIGGKVEADPHSRLDIDAIYLIADPVQTRLFKPFIDVSVSQTAPRLPVYASSRSHSTAIDRTDQRDLNGLTFTEMPWMLNEQNSRTLRQQYLQLFPEQDETLQRLFAMGYDAYQLIAILKQQQQLPALIFPGLTGQLTLTPAGSIQRRLSWAGYRNNRLNSVQEP